MQRTSRAALAAFAVVTLAVASGGCLAVFPVKTLLSTDPRASSLEFGNVPVYESRADPTSGCAQGTDSRGVYVPELSQRITITVFAKITPVPAPADQFDFRHFDFTVQDGMGNLWADVHLQGNDTLKEIVVEGPRPGGWTVTLSYNLCDLDGGPLRVDDQYHVLLIVRQPV